MTTLTPNLTAPVPTPLLAKSDRDHRDYSPTLGRWTRLDPIRFEAGDVNLYRLVFNAPTICTDPSGQIVWFFVIAGAAAGWYLLGPGAGTAIAPAPGQEHFRPPPRPFVEDAVAGIPGALVGGGAALAGEAVVAGAALLRRRLRVAPRSAPKTGVPANVQQAAQRLGVNLNNVQIQNGVANVSVGTAQTLSRADLRLLADYLRQQGATSVRIEAMVQHPQLSQMLLDPRARRLLLGHDAQVNVLGKVQLGNATERLVEIIIKFTY